MFTLWKAANKIPLTCLCHSWCLWLRPQLLKVKHQKICLYTHRFALQKDATPTCCGSYWVSVVDQGQNLVGTWDSSSFALTRRLFSLLCYLRTLFELQSSCMWSSCINPMCSLFIPHSAKEPLLIHLRELPCLGESWAFNHSLWVTACSWMGRSYLLLAEGGFSAALIFCVFSELPSLWHDFFHLPFLQLHFFLLLGHIQQHLHLELGHSSNEVPKTSHFYYNGSWKPWGGHFIIRS